ncbi:MAG: cyclase family protein [Saprospiraceae bacterium]|nr:cyclase family protein [Saprospiraceae bacterium]
MLLSTEINHKKYSFDSKEGIDLSIPYSSDYNQINCFYAPFYQDEPVRMGDFVGSVALGGPVNFFNAKINIHGNGTHTECVGHITKEREPLLTVLQDSLFLAQLMTVYPTKRENGDRVIEKFTLESLWFEDPNVPFEALVIRTLPNEIQKKQVKYSGTNPIYIDHDAMAFVADKGINHILVDIPSVDREEDGGKLEAHRRFWMDGRAKKCTITELIYVPDSVPDGIYVLNLQTASIQSDAIPSKPILYQVR